MFDIQIDKIGKGQYIAEIDGELIGFNRIRTYSPNVGLYRVATLMADEKTADVELGTHKLGNPPSKREVEAMLDMYREEMYLANIG